MTSWCFSAGLTRSNAAWAHCLNWGVSSAQASGLARARQSRPPLISEHFGVEAKTRWLGASLGFFRATPTPSLSSSFSPKGVRPEKGNKDQVLALSMPLIRESS